MDMDTHYFDTEDHVLFNNPTDTVFSWRVEGEREYEIKPGQIKRVHGSAARLYLKHMTDQIIISNNGAEKLHDAELRDEIAQQLIVRVIKDNEDIEVSEEDLKELAVKKDSAPVKQAEPEFPDLKKPEPVEPLEERKADKPIEKTATSEQPTKETTSHTEAKA